MRLREKLSLPIGIRGPFGSAKAPPAARSDNALRKERGGRRTRIRAEPPARALCGGRDGPTRGRCAAGGENQPTGVARRAGKINPRALCGGREKSTRGRCAEKGSGAPPPCRNSLLALPCPASRLHRPMPIPPKRLAPTFPRGGRSFTPRASRLGAQKKTEPKLRFFCCLFTPWNR